MNNLTTLFEDGPILQRTIAIDCDDVNFTPEQAQLFREIRNTIQDGTFGKILYDATKEYTMDDLIAIYNQYPIMGDNPRTDAILKVLEMGKGLAQTVFDLPLDLTALPDILTYTQQLCCEPILGLIQEQLAGTNPKAFPTIVEQKDVDKDLCYIYRAIHFSELRNFSRDLLKGIKGLAQLSAILKTKWKYVQYKNVRIEKTVSPQKCIVIPFAVLPP
jgi:hypothetical protein